MRRTSLAVDRSRRQAALRVSLFPFLAVLICTMGALILLLVVIARQARLQAAQAAAAEAAETAETQDDLETAREMVQWRIEQLKNSRQTTESQLAEARLGLGHIEDHARRLRERLAQLQASWDDLDRLVSDGSQQRDELEAELARVKTDLAEAERRLADARRAAAERRRSYAVVPYRGPHQTHRRPIYIECSAGAIALQPEGIVLSDEDFEGPLGPGNPLAAALRATREYLLAQDGFDPKQSGEPYPLLLIRPGGIAAYYAARAAMKSWASEFGYELIGEDWKLDFQPPDPQLAEVVRRAIDTARVQQRRLAAAAPSHYGDPQRPKYRATPTRGGIVRDDGSPDGEDSGFQPWSSGPFGGRFGPGGESHPDQTPRPDGTTPEGTVVGRPPREQEQPSAGHCHATACPGEWRPGETSAAGQSTAGEPGRHVESLAKSKGRDWALPDAAGGAVPITRPIRVECYRDRLILVPEKGLYGGKTIPLGLRTEDSVDEFVSALWEHMESWGIAGNGMYWRPILNVHVAPSAGQRYAELSTLLDGSGLTIQNEMTKHE